MRFMFRYMVPTMLAASCWLLAGCGDTGAPQNASPEAGHAATHTHDSEEVAITEADVEMPANYSDALARVESYRDAIRGAIDTGDPHGAHRPLDELDIVLRKLPEIARDSEIPMEQWETINVTARELRNAFNELHAAIDENRQPDYEAVSTSIDESVGKLNQVTK
ncbi:MAG: hypothetical protein DWQ37_03335 [Planctomycetota bacterium]|nr:MAG: hypothetical protein DWQ37_03335 [Planctomycetota bacterium]